MAQWKEKQALEAEQKRQAQEESVNAYEAAFERIKKMTDEPDLEKLVERFIEKEDANFALFNYVNEQNNRIERIQEQILAVCAISLYHTSQSRCSILYAYYR